MHWAEVWEKSSKLNLAFCLPCHYELLNIHPSLHLDFACSCKHLLLEHLSSLFHPCKNNKFLSLSLFFLAYMKKQTEQRSISLGLLNLSILFSKIAAEIIASVLNTCTWISPIDFNKLDCVCKTELFSRGWMVISFVPVLCIQPHWLHCGSEPDNPYCSLWWMLEWLHT